MNDDKNRDPDAIRGLGNLPLSPKELAAILLRVPESEIAWLDAMVIRSRVLDIATAAISAGKSADDAIEAAKETWDKCIDTWYPPDDVPIE